MITGYKIHKPERIIYSPRGSLGMGFENTYNYLQIFFRGRNPRIKAI